MQSNFFLNILIFHCLIFLSSFFHVLQFTAGVTALFELVFYSQLFQLEWFLKSVCFLLGLF